MFPLLHPPMGPCVFTKSMIPIYHKLSEDCILEVVSETADANIPPPTNAKLILL